MPAAPPTSPQPRLPSRPALKKRPTSGRGSRPHPLISRLPTQTKSRPLSHASTASSRSDDEEFGGMAFPQYCTTCEKQIEASSSEVLYCSEVCRKKDIRSSHSYMLFARDDRSPLHTPKSPSSSIFDFPIRDIIPQLSPTIPARPLPEIPNFDCDSSSTSSRGEATSRPSVVRSESEAARYLAQFHQGTPQKYSTTPMGSTPGLSSAATSLNSTTRPETPNPSTVMNPPRTRYNRWGSTFSTHSIDLVTPIAQESSLPSSPSTITPKTTRSTSTRPFDPDIGSPTSESLSWSKAKVSAGSTPKGSLKQLLSMKR